MTATKTSSKVQRGGARPGSGRPRTDRTRRNIAITEDMYTLAKQIGQRINALGGVTEDASDGIEQALKFYQAHAIQKEVLLQKLEAQGVIKRPARNGEISPFNPIKVDGEPISQMIMRERR